MSRPDSFDYPRNYRLLSSLHPPEHRGIITTPNITSPLAGATQRPSQPHKYHWQGKKSQENEVKISGHPGERLQSDPANKRSLYRYDPRCQRMLCLSTCICEVPIKVPNKAAAGPTYLDRPGGIHSHVALMWK